MKKPIVEPIFGLSWEQIQAAQQGRNYRADLPPYCAAHHSAAVQSDVDRFKIPVDRKVRDALCISLPDGYKLVGDVWAYIPVSPV